MPGSLNIVLKNKNVVIISKIIVTLMIIDWKTFGISALFCAWLGQYVRRKKKLIKLY